MQAVTASEIKFTPLEARFIQAFMDHGKANRAAKEAGCNCKSEESFAARGSQLLKKLNHPIQILMADAGLTSLELLRRIKQGLDAKEVQVHVSKSGDVKEIKIPNWHARARFTDMAIKLSGGYPKSQMDLPFEIRDGKLMIEARLETNTPQELEQ